MSEVRHTHSTCPYCGVGCGVVIESLGSEIVGVRGDPAHPANFGRLCSKGSTLHLTARKAVQMQVRALRPEMRTSRDAPRRATDWDSALDLVTQRIAQSVLRHGPDSIGLYISGQLLTEDYYVFNKLAKGLIGTNNVDTNSRLCMSSAVAGYKAALGADAPPACYDDIDHAEVIFIVGSNTAFAHPVLFRRIEDAKARNADLKLIVVDPRRTHTAAQADVFLPILPGSDVALFHGMLHILLWEGLVDEAYIAAHTEGFAELKRLVRDYTPRRTAELCGIREADLTRAALMFGRAKAVLSLYCQGLNQSSSGTAKNAALINLHLATGRIGKPGAGPFSLTGQPNAMGGREVGGMANLLSAHRDIANAQHRAEVAALWGVDSVPETPGKTAVEMFDAARSGEIKVLWIICTNPAQSMPDQRAVREALRKAEFVIVQEAYASTATVDFADVLLPATTWGEKDGTVTNSERRISRVRAAVSAPGEARHDWQIACAVARRLESTLRPGKPTLFPYESTQAIWNEHRETTRGRDLDITDLSYTILDEQGPQQWPFPSGASHGKTRLYEDGVFATANGKATFVAAAHKPVAEEIDARFPFRLTTGRLRDQWHGMSRTGTLGRLFAHVPEASVELNANDMARRGLVDGDLVEVRSRRGAQILPAAASDALRSGQAFMAMHWGAEYVAGAGLAGEAGLGVNGMTSPVFDPISKQPELKHAAAKITKAELPWRFVAFGFFDEHAQLAVQRELRAFFEAFAFATCVPFGRDAEHAGIVFRAASAHAPDVALIARIEATFGLSGSEVLAYDDARRALRRRVRVVGGKLVAVALAGDTSAEAWLKDYLENDRPVDALGRLLLMPSRGAPQGFAARGKVICNCFNVAQAEIETFVAQARGTSDALLPALQAALHCGTQCGSCVPELKKLIASKSEQVDAVRDAA